MRLSDIPVEATVFVLFINDATHIALMAEQGIEFLATFDHDLACGFHNLLRPGLTILKRRNGHGGLRMIWPRSWAQT